MGYDFWRRRACLGLDIGSDRLTLVEVQGRRRSVSAWTACVSVPLETGWVVQGVIEEPDRLLERLRDVLQQQPFKARRVAMALPASSVYTCIRPAPSATGHDAWLQAIERLAAESVPYPLSDVCLDHVRLPANPAQPDAERVLLVAARRELVRQREALALAAGLQPCLLDIEAYAIRRGVRGMLTTLPEQGRQQRIGLCQVMDDAFHLQILCDGELLFERVHTAHSGLARVDADGLSGMNTARLGHVEEVSPSYASVTGSGTGVARDLARLLQHYFSSATHHRLDVLWLSGAGAALPGLLEAMQTYVRCPVHRVDPFGSTTTPPLCALPEAADRAAYTVAAGLALGLCAP